MASNPTVSELRKAVDITDDEVEAAIDAYLGDPKFAPFHFACGHAINVAAAVEVHQPAKAAMIDPDRSAEFKRNMVRTAILLAHPVKT